MKIGILYICTGKYSIFWKDFYLTCEKNFITEAEKHYFVFTDSSEIEFRNENKNIHLIFQKNLGWPDNTLRRYEVFLSIKKQLQYFDFLFFFNSNLLFMKEIKGSDFLPNKNQDLVACLHPGYFNKKRNNFTYEINQKSTAFIPKNKGKYYFAGGINGGTTKSFIEAMITLDSNIKEDDQNEVTAKWHDESHWNKYLIDKTDNIKILNHLYLYPESSKKDEHQIIMLRDKRKYFGYLSVGKINENKITEKLKKYLKQISFIRDSYIWKFIGKWLRRITLLKSVYKYQKKEAFKAYLKMDQEEKIILKNLKGYLNNNIYDFNGLKIPKSMLSIDNLFNILLPHISKLKYTKIEIEKFYTDLQNKYTTLIYWKNNIGTKEPDYIGAHLISHGFTYLMNEINISKDDVVFDIGAAPGDFCALSLLNGASKVYAFEPENIQVDVLEKISRLNGERIQIVQKYCDQVENLNSTTIDKFVQENNIEKINFIKMDIEGAEPRALKGAQLTLKKFRPKLSICTYHNKGDAEDIEKAILNANPDYIIYNEPGVIYAY
jgi:hypothetical protein